MTAAVDQQRAGARPICGHVRQSLHRHNVYTYASALSKLSLKIPVTALSMSKLSVASVRIFCAACVAAPAVGTATPFAPCLPCGCVRNDDGDVAREAGRDRGDGPASPGP